MGDQSGSTTPPPITCRNCGATWPRLWIARREIEQCPHCHADLAREPGDVSLGSPGDESLLRDAAASG